MGLRKIFEHLKYFFNTIATKFLRYQQTLLNSQINSTVYPFSSSDGPVSLFLLFSF